MFQGTHHLIAVSIRQISGRGVTWDAKEKTPQGGSWQMKAFLVRIPELHDGGASQDFNGITGSCFAKLIFVWRGGVFTLTP